MMFQVMSAMLLVALMWSACSFIIFVLHDCTAMQEGCSGVSKVVLCNIGGQLTRSVGDKGASFSEHLFVGPSALYASLV